MATGATERSGERQSSREGEPDMVTATRPVVRLDTQGSGLLSRVSYVTMGVQLGGRSHPTAHGPGGCRSANRTGSWSGVRVVSLLLAGASPSRSGPWSRAKCNQVAVTFACVLVTFVASIVLCARVLSRIAATRWDERPRRHDHFRRAGCHVTFERKARDRPRGKPQPATTPSRAGSPFSASPADSRRGRGHLAWREARNPKMIHP
jgi:hypothetical protein